MTPGQRLKKIRKQKSLDQLELASKLGHKTVRTVNRWEADHFLPNGRELKALAEILDVSVDYLLGLDHLIRSKD